MKKESKMEAAPENNGNASAIPGERKHHNNLNQFFNHFSTSITKITGGMYAFIFALIIVIVWAFTGPVFHYSDTWQLVINTGTTIVTFLMVFIIQHSQNKDTIALQLKLNELIAASKASNKLISVENLSDEDLEKYNEFYSRVSIKAREGMNQKVSVDDAPINIDTDNVDIHITNNKIS
jgi:low affinity Fe/Cu permease